MTLYKGAKLQILDSEGKPESGGQRLFEVTQVSYVDSDGFCLVRLKVIE
jgi:hypothetical protein